jgi:integrase/recombinase XerD
VRTWGEAQRKAAELAKRIESGEPTGPHHHALDAAIRNYLSYVGDPRQYGQELSRSAFGKHRRMTSLLFDFCKGKGILSIQEITPKVISEWRGTWKFKVDSSSMRVHDAIARAFFKWALSMRIVDCDPYDRLPRYSAKDPQTLPLTENELRRLLQACDEIAAPPPDKHKLRALVLLMRWSGLSVIDALTLPRTKLVENALELRRTKTGEAVLTVVPQSVADTLRLLPNDHPGYFFWDGKMTLNGLRAKWLGLMRKAFDRAGISRSIKTGGMTLSHRLRDTYAVEYLLAGGDIHDLAMLLRHSSIVTTEKHYGAWVPKRKERLLKVAEEIIGKQEPVGLNKPLGRIN